LCPLKRGAAFYDDLLSQRSFNVPLYDYLCLDCAQVSELLVTGSNEKPACAACGSRNLRKMLSAHSSLSGTRTTSFPQVFPDRATLHAADPVRLMPGAPDRAAAAARDRIIRRDLSWAFCRRQHDSCRRPAIQQL